MARSSVPPACPSCSGPLIEIHLGAELSLRSCSTCDSRWWRRADEATSLDEVLDVVADSTPRRTPSRAAR